MSARQVVVDRFIISLITVQISVLMCKNSAIIIIIRIVHEVHNLKKASKHYNTMQKIFKKIHSLRTIRTYSRNTHIYIIPI